MLFRVAPLIVLILSLSGPARAWNDKGHFVITRLAWQQLTPELRASAISLLKAHPHYEEYLAAERPADVDLDEWVFMRASYWPDWVRSHHSDQYNQPTWHYISAAYVPPYSDRKASELASVEPNVVTQITASIDKLKSGTAQEKPIYLCWLLHLVGDIHQPLHNCSLLSDTFPEADRGGNLSEIRVADGSPVKLHFMFDALLGEPLLPPAIPEALPPGAIAKAIDETIVEVQQAESDDCERIRREIANHARPAEWSREGFALAVEFAYLGGALRPAHAENRLSEADVPQVAELFVQNARRMARVQAAKAARRLATSIAAGIGK